MQRIVEGIWDLLGDDAALFFGRECLSVTLWMLSCLLLRTIFIWFRLSLIPFGLISHLPLLFAMLQAVISIVIPVPLLTFRLAEIMLGRVSTKHVTALIPAHFLGAIIGAVLFKGIFLSIPLFDEQGILPQESPVGSMLTRIALDTSLVFLYICALHIVPQITKVNKLPRLINNISVTPLLILSFVERGNTFNPATLYALRFVQSEQSFSLSYFLQHVYLLGPIVGAVAAGLVCVKYFPDDSKQWQSSKKKRATK